MTKFDVSSTYYTAGVGPCRWETLGTLEAATLDDAAVVASATYPDREVIVSASPLPPGQLPPLLLVSRTGVISKGALA